MSVMSENYDSRVVRTVRSLRKFRTQTSDSTRTSTPSQESQVTDSISSREELQQVLETSQVSPEDLYQMIKTDPIVVRALLNDAELSEETLLRIQEKIQETNHRKKIENAKKSVNDRIKERMEALKKKLSDS
mmetsp:Transcript_13471/g.19682  ORF Transcript_13471/g.19682 Transcript_13471/m.19682 type:complete len:132 (+) Transcript_13471:1873-2268(+)